MKWLQKLFNQHKIDEANAFIDVYKDRINQLESEISTLKDYKMKYEVTKMYVDDDEALLELFEVNKSKINESSYGYGQALALRQSAIRQINPQAVLGHAGVTGGLGVGRLGLAHTLGL